jgi:hypothetical protein
LPLARHGDDQRHTGTLFKQAHLLPEAVLSQVVTVIAREDDDRVVGQVESLECIEDASDLRVHERDTGEIRLHGLPAQLVVQQFVLLLVASKGCGRKVLLVFLNTLHQRHALLRISFKVRLWRNVRRMWPIKADRQKERTAPVARTPLEYPLRVARQHPVGVQSVAAR